MMTTQKTRRFAVLTAFDRDGWHTVLSKHEREADAVSAALGHPGALAVEIDWVEAGERVRASEVAGCRICAAHRAWPAGK